MTTVILATADYPAIRYKLGIQVEELPDLEIDSIGLLQVAEAQIMAVVTDYASLSGSNQVFCKAATLALCASFACGALNVKRGQAFKLGEMSESETKMDWISRQKSLLDEARGYILQISTHAQSARPKLFAAGGPTSSGTNWPTLVDQWYGKVQPALMRWLRDNGQRLYGWENQP